MCREVGLIIFFLPDDPSPVLVGVKGHWTFQRLHRTQVDLLGGGRPTPPRGWWVNACLQIEFLWIILCQL